MDTQLNHFCFYYLPAVTDGQFTEGLIAYGELSMSAYSIICGTNNGSIIYLHVIVMENIEQSVDC